MPHGSGSPTICRLNEYGYGLWFAVIVNSAVFIIFAASFCHPATRRDWRALGGFSAFVVALFTEMYRQLLLHHRRLLADRSRVARSP